MANGKVLAILGGTGKIGRHLVGQALEAGYQARLLVRDPSKVTFDAAQLDLVTGDVLDPDWVESVVAGTDAVLSTLGHTKTSPRDILTRATEHILEAMGTHDVRRLVVLTGAGVLMPEDPPRGLLNRGIEALLRRLQPALLADAQQMTEMVMASDRDWVIVRAPIVVEGGPTASYRAGYLPLQFGARVTRGDIAHLMLRCVRDDTHLRQAPLIVP